MSLLLWKSPQFSEISVVLHHLGSQGPLEGEGQRSEPLLRLFKSSSHVLSGSSLPMRWKEELPLISKWKTALSMSCIVLFSVICGIKSMLCFLQAFILSVQKTLFLTQKNLTLKAILSRSHSLL